MGTVKKILFVATVYEFFLQFQLPYLQWLTNEGHEIHVAGSGEEQIPFAIQQFNLSIQRSPFKWKNVRAFFELKKILRENKYHLIHCHTPMGGVITRLAARKFRKENRIKVLYTAHGFHFYKGAPLLNWLLFYPVEKILARYTDGLITINREDFENAKRFRFVCPEIYSISGIGVNTDKFKPVCREEKNQIRKIFGYSENAFLLVYAAEFIDSKNHRFIINAIPEIQKHIPNLKVIFAGIGEQKETAISEVKKMGLSDTVDFVGYRNDLEKWMAMADVCISTSKREGLPMNVAEAMFCGLPVVISQIRGHVDLVTNGVNGLLFDLENREGFVSHVLELYRSPALRARLGVNAMETVQPFGIENVIPQMTKIYINYLGDA